jgi:hypothetical protein
MVLAVANSRQRIEETLDILAKNLQQADWLKFSEPKVAKMTVYNFL